MAGAFKICGWVLLYLAVAACESEGAATADAGGAAGGAGILSDVPSLPGTDCAIELVASLDLQELATDIAVRGSRAYVAVDYRGLVVVDISDPLAPAELGVLPVPERAQRLVIDDERALAFMTTVDRGLLIADIKNPAQPLGLGSLDTPVNTWGLDVDGHHVYLGDMDGGMITVDVSDPMAPVALATVGGEGWVRDVDVHEGVAWMAVGGFGMRVADVSDPENPAILSELDMPGWPFGITVRDDHTVFLADSGLGTRIFDGTNPTAPKLLATHYSHQWNANVTLAGDLAVIPSAARGFELVDISDPAAPDLLGFHQERWTWGAAVVGSYVFSAAASKGLQVVEICNETGVEAGADVGAPAAPIETCGDGEIQVPGEQCDDGARGSGDGCDADCQREPDWDCDSASPTVCFPPATMKGVAVVAELDELLRRADSSSFPVDEVVVATLDFGPWLADPVAAPVLASTSVDTAECGTSSSGCAFELPRKGLTGSEGLLLRLTDLDGLMAPTLVRTLTAEQIDALGAGELQLPIPALGVSLEALEVLSQSVAAALGETWSEGELLCRGVTLLSLATFPSDPTGFTADLGGLDATVFYLNEAAGAGPDGNLYTEDDDIVGLLSGAAFDNLGAALLVPNAPCASAQAGAGTVQVGDADDLWISPVGWGPGTLLVLPMEEE